MVGGRLVYRACPPKGALYLGLRTFILATYRPPFLWKAAKIRSWASRTSASSFLHKTLMSQFLVIWVTERRGRVILAIWMVVSISHSIPPGATMRTLHSPSLEMSFPPAQPNF